MTLRCEQIFELLSDYLDGELEPATREAFEAHIQGCTKCARFGQDFAEVVNGLKSGARPAMSLGLRQRLRGLFEAES